MSRDWSGYSCGGVTTVLSYIGLAYLLSSLLYVIITFRFETPFDDSLTDTQRSLMRESSKKRGVVFGVSFIVLISVLAVLRPFRYQPCDARTPLITCGKSA